MKKLFVCLLSVGALFSSACAPSEKVRLETKMPNEVRLCVQLISYSANASNFDWEGGYMSLHESEIRVLTPRKYRKKQLVG
jgi:hypothetical protein